MRTTLDENGELMYCEEWDCHEKINGVPMKKDDIIKKVKSMSLKGGDLTLRLKWFYWDNGVPFYEDTKLLVLPFDKDKMIEMLSRSSMEYNIVWIAKYIVYLDKSEDHQTNIDSDVIDTFIEFAEQDCDDEIPLDC